MTGITQLDQQATQQWVRLLSWLLAYCSHVVADKITMAEVRRSTCYHVYYYEINDLTKPTNRNQHTREEVTNTIFVNKPNTHEKLEERYFRPVLR